MRLRRARVQNYRSVKDSGWFQLDEAKTILVGPNEGGKTAVLRALEQLNPGRLARQLDPLRDFPRADYYRIQSGELRPADILVVEAEYDLDESERSALTTISPLLGECRYYRSVHLDGSVKDALLHAPEPPTMERLGDPLRTLGAYADRRLAFAREAKTETDAFSQQPAPTTASAQLELILAGVTAGEIPSGAAARLVQWLDAVVVPLLDPAQPQQMAHVAAVRDVLNSLRIQSQGLIECRRRLPVMVYVSTYPSVTPILHLGHLADAVDAGAINETDEYNYGNFCLLNLLNFSARQLSDLGKAKEPETGDHAGFEQYRAQLDERDAALNSASLKLTSHLRAVWQGQSEDDGYPQENFTVRITADQQYLKVVVEDSLGVQIELDQRSEGFKWLVSFFIVFFGQAASRSGDAILLLDEPGLSLHGLKQRQFRHTLSKLGEANQLVFTTHSPFLIGANELGLVRLVELPDRRSGTEVHGDLVAQDPASLLPLQEALAYDMATSFFAGRRTFVLESLADYFYLQATATLLADAGIATLDRQIELVPASTLAKMAYYSTFLQAEGLQVAALLDSDTAGPRATEQQQLVETLGDTRVVRTKDVYSGPVQAPHIEELLRDTLVAIGKDIGWDVSADIGRDWGALPITQVFAEAVGPEFTPYRLAKEYVDWTRDHHASDLTPDERVTWMYFIERVNKAFS